MTKSFGTSANENGRSSNREVERIAATYHPDAPTWARTRVSQRSTTADALDRGNDRRRRDAVLLVQHFARRRCAEPVDANRLAAIADILAPAKRDAGLDRHPLPTHRRQYRIAIRRILLGEQLPRRHRHDARRK